QAASFRATHDPAPPSHPSTPARSRNPRALPPPPADDAVPAGAVPDGYGAGNEMPPQPAPAESPANCASTRKRGSCGCSHPSPDRTDLKSSPPPKPSIGLRPPILHTNPALRKPAVVPAPALDLLRVASERAATAFPLRSTLRSPNFSAERPFFARRLPVSAPAAAARNRWPTSAPRRLQTHRGQCDLERVVYAATKNSAPLLWHPESPAETAPARAQSDNRCAAAPHAAQRCTLVRHVRGRTGPDPDRHPA